MQLSKREVLRGIAAGTVSLTAVGQATGSAGTRYVATVSRLGIRRRVERAGFTVNRTLADGRVLLVTGPADARADLANVRGVRAASKDLTFRLDTPEFAESTEESTDDAFFPLQWDKQDLTTDATIAHDTATGDGTRLATVDTGVWFDHPDLAPNTNPEASYLFRMGEVRSGEGAVEVPKDPLDLSQGTEVVTQHVADDVYGHGTHVSGIAAASDDGTTGVVGTAPDAEVVSLRVFWWDENGEGTAVLGATFGGILSAIDAAADLGADAANLSIGTPPLPPRFNATGIRGASELVIQNAVRRGTAVVVSAGNADANLQQGGYFTWPNSMAGAMSISATGPNDELVFYSNYGTNEVTVGAPGGGYETLAKTLCADWDGDGDGEYPVGDTDGDGETDYRDCHLPEWPFPTNLVLNAMAPDTLLGLVTGENEYAYVAGTSMAAPQVAGTVGLVREVAPRSTARQVQRAIEDGAELATGDSSAELGAGRLNAAKTLESDVLE